MSYATGCIKTATLMRDRAEGNPRLSKNFLSTLSRRDYSDLKLTEKC